MHGIAMTTSKQNHGGRFEATTKYQVPTPVVVIISVTDVIGRLSTRKDQLFRHNTKIHLQAVASKIIIATKWWMKVKSEGQAADQLFQLSEGVTKIHPQVDT